VNRLAQGCPNGRRFGSELAALKAVSKGADGTPFKCGRCPSWHLAEPAEHTGFSRAVKLLVRVRAGGGDLEKAACEACGVWCGPLLGEIQHIVARGMGGTSLAVMNSAANGSLLCGSAVLRSGDHGRAEARDTEMELKGFYVKGRKDPRLVKMTLFDGREVYRSEDGRYLDKAPLEVAALWLLHRIRSSRGCAPLRASSGHGGSTSAPNPGCRHPGRRSRPRC
jgi:hypothetical protein